MYKTNEIVNRLYLKQPGYTYTYIYIYIYIYININRNQPDKACFQHDLAYGDFKASDKVWGDKAFNTRNQESDGYRKRLASMLQKLSLDSGIREEIKQSQQLSDEIHKPIIKKYKKEKFIHDLMTIFGVPI